MPRKEFMAPGLDGRGPFCLADSQSSSGLRGTCFVAPKKYFLGEEDYYSRPASAGTMLQVSVSLSKCSSTIPVSN
jgi:hypothetical protein